MNILKTLTAFLLLAIMTSTVADAQLRRLANRAKERAEERLEEKAEEEVDRQVDKAVDELWDESGDAFSAMLESAMPKAKTEVDLDEGVIRREGMEDMEIRDNATGPADADFIRYTSVSTVNLPSQLAGLAAAFGTSTVEEIYLHGDRRYAGNESTGTTIDAAETSYTVYDHERMEYWTMDFDETFAFAGDAIERANEQLEAEAGNAPPPSDVPDYEVEAEIYTREGDRGNKRGLDAQQHFVIVETVAEDPESSGSKGKFYVVSEIWTAEEYAGSRTIDEFGRKVGAGLLQSAHGSGIGSSLQLSAFNDPRMEEAMEKMSETFGSIQGFPVETTTYFVSGPLDEDLDLDAILNPQGEADVQSFAGTSSNQPVQSQTTMFSTVTFITNLSTEPFDVSLLGDRGYTEIESPLKQYLEAQD